MDLLEDRPVAVGLKDGSTASYTMRGLRDDEIPSWAVFCASVFSYKTNPPSPTYFERHFFNDPKRDAGLVRVIFFENTVVSSCRIFRREVSVGRRGESMSAGGIGEVCTDVNHQKRGLSKTLLQDAIRIMKLCHMKVSLLHAAPEFQPVYERNGGYTSVRSAWSLVPIELGKLPNRPRLAEGWTVRKAEFPRDASQLRALHTSFSESRFVGCIVRSLQYWNEYLSKELEHSLFLLETTDDEIGAWMSIRPRGAGRKQMREFGYDASKVNATLAISSLLPMSLSYAQDADDSVLHLPSFVVEQLEMEGKQVEFFDWDAVQEQDDDGWMYTMLDPGQAPLPVGVEPHLIWPSDSF